MKILFLFNCVHICVIGSLDAINKDTDPAGNSKEQSPDSIDGTPVSKQRSEIIPILRRLDKLEKMVLTRRDTKDHQSLRKDTTTGRKV